MSPANRTDSAWTPACQVPVATPALRVSCDCAAYELPKVSSPPMPRRIRSPATMSVTRLVRSLDRFRSTSCAWWRGRSSTVLDATSSGAAMSTMMPSFGEVEIMTTTSTTNAPKAAMVRCVTSRTAPNTSESPELTLSTSPVGVRRGSTWPSSATLATTSSIVPYRVTSQARTTYVCQTIPIAVPKPIATNSARHHRIVDPTSPARMPRSIARPTAYGASAGGRNQPESREGADRHQPRLYAHDPHEEPRRRPGVDGRNVCTGAQPGREVDHDSRHTMRRL